MSRVLVVGGGVAGMSCATFLSMGGMDVVVVEKRKEPLDLKLPKVGESLPPDARKLLNQLGVFQEFQSAPHLPCFGNRSHWAGNQPIVRDFMNHPLGHGWHIDRPLFEGLLERRVRKLGVSIIRGVAMDSLDRNGCGWQLDLDDGVRQFDFVIDASGRQSWFAKRQGVRRIVECRQVALVAFLQARQAMEDGMSLVESGPEGWWYSAAIPGARLSSVFMVNPDQKQSKAWCRGEGWRNLVNRSPHTAKRINDGGFRLIRRPRFVSSESGILETMSGDAWLAIGDAAMSYDPIASHGITMAMTSARDAAKAVLSRWKGDNESFLQYDLTLKEAFGEYSRRRQLLYDELRGGGQVATSH